MQADKPAAVGKVIIGTDLVYLSVTGSKGLLNAQPDGTLVISPGAELVIPFSRFDGGFVIGSSGTLFTSDGTGDRWELA